MNVGSTKRPQTPSLAEPLRRPDSKSRRPENIKLRWKRPTKTNTLDYNSTLLLITTLKSFIGRAPGAPP